MRTKVYLIGLFCLFFMQLKADPLSDSITQVRISNLASVQNDKQIYGLSPIEFVFFDEHSQQLYFDISMTGKQGLEAKNFVFIEIKKHSNMQHKFRPLFAQKINLNSFQQAYYFDSISFVQHPFESGNYDMMVYLMADSAKVLQMIKSPFQVYNPGYEASQTIAPIEEIKPQVSNVDIASSFVTKYSVDQLRKNILALQPIARGAEVKVIKQMNEQNDLAVMRQFFFNFWQNRLPSNPEQAWKEYADRLNVVSKLYGTASSPGYTTDRGRIYLDYGVPDKEEKIQNEKNTHPYEVWFYYNAKEMKNVKFLFFQPGVLGSQVYLLHSNVESEVINVYWKDVLFTDMVDVHDKLTHRVFEYFN